MLRKLLKIFLWIVSGLSLFVAIFFVVIAIQNHLHDTKCGNSKIVINIKPGQDGEYEIVIPEFLSYDAALYVNTELISGELDHLKTYGLTGNWILKDKNGKEIFKDNLLFNSGWCRWVKNWKNCPARYIHLWTRPKFPVKLLFSVKATGEKPSISSDCQLVFQPFLEFGPMVTMTAIVFSVGAFIIAFFSGLILYKIRKTKHVQVDNVK